MQQRYKIRYFFKQSAFMKSRLFTDRQSERNVFTEYRSDVCSVYIYSIYDTNTDRLFYSNMQNDTVFDVILHISLRKTQLPGRIAGQDGIVPFLERRCTAVQAYVSTERGSLLCRYGRRVWYRAQTQAVQDRGYASKLNKLKLCTNNIIAVTSVSFIELHQFRCG